MSKKDTFGEVFTPPALIQELLEHLPKRVWGDSTLQWLDPCAGQGNFLDKILPRLMDGLAQEFPHIPTRRRHILQHMVTQIELNPANVRILRRKYPDAGVRIVSGDFLEQQQSKDTKEDMTKNVLKYDVIVANPPYQAPKDTTYKGSAGNRTLWDAFVTQALQQSTPRTGVLGFITPANWRRPDHELWTTLRERLLYLHIYGKSAGKEWFGVQTRFDVYVLEEKPRRSNNRPMPIPLLVDELGEKHEKSIVPGQWPFLPNGMYRSIQRLLVKPSQREDGVHIIHDSSMYDARKLTRRPTTAHPYPVVHTLTQAGMGLRYAATKDSSQFGVPKVILNVNEKQYPVNDWQGKYGMSQLSFGLPIRSRAEGDRLVACIQSPWFQDVVKLTKWGSFQTDHRMFSYFRRDFCSRKEITKKQRTTTKNRTKKKR